MKIWLDDVRVAMNIGLSERDVRDALVKTREERGRFLEAWHAYFG